MRRLCIIVVDDHDELRERVRAALADQGHQVIGLAMAAEDVDDEPVGFVCDLYIIDRTLPGEGGLALAARLRRSQPDVGIVIVSGRDTVRDRIESYQSGANLHMGKPFDIDELSAVVTGFADRKSRAQARAEDCLRLWPLQMQLSGPVGTSRLSQSELVLLSAFSRAAQQSLEHWQIDEHVGHGRELTSASREMAIGRLRKKLVSCGAPTPAIMSIRGYGYRLCHSVAVLAT